MYRCCSFKRFFFLLLCDAIVLLVLTTLLRNVLTTDTAAPVSEEPGICVPIIMYHSVYDGRESDYVVSTEILRQDFSYLKETGYQPVLISDLVAYVYEGAPLPAHSVAITFDDGFYNNLDTVLPLLEEYDFCATISVVGAFIESQSQADSHHNAYSYLTYADIQTLLDSGRIEIGNHTWQMHSNTKRSGCAILPYETEAAYAQALKADLGALQTTLQQEVGILPTVFAYPYGFICEESIPVLHELGFLATLTCYEAPNYITRSPDCLYGLYRYNRTAQLSTEAFMQIALKGT